MTKGMFYFIGYVIIFMMIVISFPKEKQQKLLNVQQEFDCVHYRVAGKLCVVAFIVSVYLTPSSYTLYEVRSGQILWCCGMVILILSLVTFCKTAVNQPVTSGIYALSRNPQIIGIWLVFLGVAVMSASYFALGCVALNMICYHQRIKAEEVMCLTLYGESYLQYYKKVPRYLIVKTKYEKTLK